MPIRDHFHPPLAGRPSWEAVHSMWIGQMAAELNEKWLPPAYRAETETHYGPDLAYDVGVIREPGAAYTTAIEGPATPVPDLPLPDASCAFDLVPSVRMLIYNGDGRLVGAVELVSPRNKDRPTARDGFAAKIQSYLQAEVSLAVVDVVTAYRANLHNHWRDQFAVAEAPSFAEGTPESLYAAAYHPRVEAGSVYLDFWLRSFTGGSTLPVLPLFIRDDLAVPLELEVSYVTACRRLRVVDVAA